jgi:hypothetical protein
MFVRSTALPCHHHHAHGRISDLMAGHASGSSAAIADTFDPKRNARPSAQAQSRQQKNRRLSEHIIFSFLLFFIGLF